MVCGFVKRCCEETLWEDNIGDKAKFMLREIKERIFSSDPLGDRWAAMSDTGEV